MFDSRRVLRLPLFVAAAAIVSLTAACGNVTGPQGSPLKAPDAPSRYIQPSGIKPTTPIPTQKDTTGGKSNTAGYNVWA